MFSCDYAEGELEETYDDHPDFHQCNLLTDCIVGVVGTFPAGTVGHDFIKKQNAIKGCKKIMSPWGPAKFANYSYMVASRTRYYSCE